MEASKQSTALKVRIGESIEQLFLEYSSRCDSNGTNFVIIKYWGVASCIVLDVEIT